MNGVVEKAKKKKQKRQAQALESLVESYEASGLREEYQRKQHRLVQAKTKPIFNFLDPEEYRGIKEETILMTDSSQTPALRHYTFNERNERVVT